MRRINFSILFVAAVVAVFGFTGFAECDEPIVKVENNGDSLVFHPMVEFKQLILTVTGPCDYQYRQVVDEGQPFFKLNKETIDGAYTYGVTRMEKIDREIIEMLQKARIKQDDGVARQLCRDGKLPGPPLNQSGGFMVLKGEIIFDSRPEGKAVTKELDAGGLNGQMSLATSYEIIGRDGTVTEKVGSPDKDFVINDDLIVDGSACIGFDCVNGESFGFDTIRLKENNLRIKFDDTSVAASFPRTDWQLTANASANGGASKFSIDDISGNRTPFTVEANARSHSLYVDDGGRIGSRTSTPSVEIHTIDGDTPTLRLQQDGSSGFAPQTWDVAGNETNFFVRDVTNGSQLPFRIRPDAPSSSVFIDVDGDVGFGTSSPEAALHTLRSGGTASARTMLHLENNGGVRFDFEDTNAGSFWRFQTANSNNEIQITRSGTGETELLLDNDGNLEITGDLTVVGGCTGCDAVFQPDYELESIEEHAALMWENSYLPAVGPTAEGKTKISVFQKTTGILNELEKAHIYIEQLHTTIQDLQERLEKLENGTSE